MKYKKLGTTDLDVSLICLGTMTWGEQNSQQEAFDQMDLALDHGVNFWDAAEMYPVPVKADTYGETERIIGNWLSNTGRRDDVILATKVTGRSDRTWMRDGAETRLTREQVNQAIDNSLKRLQTDYVDLYQVHWPDRQLGLWGEGSGSYVHKDNADEVAIGETLDALADLVKAGKVRHIGVSNETPWGLSQYLQLSETTGAPRVMSIQNSYSLINRIFEIGLSEFSYREEVGLLAYTPLGMGTLSGKYVGDTVPDRSRLDLFPEFMDRYQKAEVKSAIEGYVALARDHGLTPTQLALGFVNTRPFVTANIIGATTLEQLEENIATVDVEITEEIEEGIREVHLQCKNPAAA